MTDDEIRDMARTVAREVVHEMMLTMGVDASKPAGLLEMQKDFQSLREWRNSMDAIRRHDPGAAARIMRRDNELFSKGVQSLLKQPLGMTRVAQTSLAALEPATADGIGLPPPQEEEPDDLAGYGDAMPTAEETQGMGIVPILLKDASTGQLSIRNFKSLSLVGGQAECLDMGQAMLENTGMSNDLLKLVVSSEVITIAKICARNGAVVISCRNEQITVSPRRSRPDDECMGGDHPLSAVRG